MSKTMTSLRGTGRTTRMLEHAKVKAREGRAVYILADNRGEQNRLTIALGPEGKELGIRVETPDTIGNFDWSMMRVPGMHPNCVVLVDHHTIEDRFSEIVTLLHAYDA